MNPGKYIIKKGEEVLNVEVTKKGRGYSVYRIEGEDKYGPTPLGKFKEWTFEAVA